MIVIKNAVIEGVSLDDAGRGLLTAYLHLDYGGTHQGFGGYTLYLPKSFRHHKLESVAGHFIWRCMEIAGVTSWKDMPGKTIRVKASEGAGFSSDILAIGHIVKDDWFSPKDDFANLSD